MTAVSDSTLGSAFTSLASSGERLRRDKATCGNSEPAEEYPTICLSHAVYPSSRS